MTQRRKQVPDVSRRRFVAALSASVGSVMVAGCDRLSRTEWLPGALGLGADQREHEERANRQRRHQLGNRRQLQAIVEDADADTEHEEALWGEPGMPVPQVLVLAPPALKTPQGAIAPKFAGAESRCVGVAEAYRVVSDELGCAFFDAGSVIESSPIDGVHLEKGQHLALALALVNKVTEILRA